MSGELEALAARVEAATGPDRDLDAAIHGAIGDDFRRYQIEKLGAFGPTYTASLDAAMTLVPEGWRIYRLDASIRNRFSWHLQGPMEYENEEPTGPATAHGLSSSIERALTAAAFRARASLAREPGEGRHG